MKKSLKKRFSFINRLLIITPIFAMIILIITNPTRKDFIEFVPSKIINLESEHHDYHSYSCHVKSIARESNYLIFSIYIVEFNCIINENYRFSLGWSEKHKFRYLGIAKNFHLKE